MRLSCPAAVELAQASGTPSVLCGELHIHDEYEAPVSPVMDGDSDRTAIAVYCAGEGVPGAVNSYCECPIWQAARRAQWAREGKLTDTGAARNRGPAGARQALPYMQG